MSEVTELEMRVTRVTEDAEQATVECRFERPFGYIGEMVLTVPDRPDWAQIGGRVRLRIEEAPPLAIPPGVRAIAEAMAGTVNRKAAGVAPVPPTTRDG